MNQKENNVFKQFADALNNINEQQKVNTNEIKKLDNIEKKLNHISKQVDNHIPTKIKEIDEKIDKVIEGQGQMWPKVCDSNKLAAEAFNGLKNLTERLIRRKIVP